MAKFSTVDKALLDRSARILRALASNIEQACGSAWGGHRDEKLEFDRLMRDERDLRALGKRLAGEAKAPAALPVGLDAIGYLSAVAELSRVNGLVLTPDINEDGNLFFAVVPYTMDRGALVSLASIPDVHPVVVPGVATESRESNPASTGGSDG